MVTSPTHGTSNPMTPQGLLQRRLKAEGRCVTCCQPHDSGLARCRGCQDKVNARTREIRRRMVALGRCRHCRGEMAVSGFTACFDCRLRLTVKRKRRYRRAKLQRAA